jgi:Superinfection immunity protein/Protein of unknown function (DUF2510)
VFDSSGSGGGSAVLGLFLIGLYFLPLVIAASRKVSNIGSVAVINIFLGWTLIGWVIALAMAARTAPPAHHQVNVYAHTPPPQQFHAPAAPIQAPPSLVPSGHATAGWYADPLGRSRVRYFDGTAWTDHVD